MINQLKSLELQGYKTFASRTLFEFPGQVTAIVGPNGSGKSNIADAIRWVLGEQAYTLLRGKKTVDMIFSGSEQRPRSSMASVSITFDNQTSWLPIDFSEVVITRRAYRSGENEYLLNNHRVRLKEINELLANSGLGERTYTIIGQGLVDSALSLRPEERRRFFEEAAGIGLYRSRREEAIQKLDKTQRNMERVTDIMGELSPRLKSLEKSREKAIQYKQIQDDLFLLLRDWYGYYWHAAMKELNTAKDFYKQQRENFEVKQSEKESIEEKLNQTQHDISQNRNHLADLHQELSQNHQEKEETTRELAVLEEREKSLKNRIQEIAHTIQLLSMEAENEHKKVVDLENVNQSLLEDFRIAQEELSVAELQIGEKNQKLAELNRNISENRKSVLLCESSINQLEADIQNRRKEIKAAAQERARSQEFIEKSMAERSRLEQMAKEADQQIAARETEINQSVSAISSMTSHLSELHGKMEGITRDLQRLDVEKSRYEAELAMLEEDEANLAGFSSGSSEIIQAAKDGKLKGSFRPVLQYLEIPEKYEVCISAALGDILEGVIASDSAEPSELIQYLDRHNIRRTAIINEKSPVGFTFPEKQRETDQLASDLVRAENPFAERIRQLLSRTLVADDYSAAIRLSSDLQIGWKIATLAGEVIEADGVISAGKPKGIKPVKRKREKEKVSGLLASLEKESKEFIRSLESIKEEIQNKENELRINNEHLQEARVGLQQISLDNHKKQIELAQLSRVIDQEKIRIAEVEKNLARLEQSIPAFEEELHALKIKIADLEREEAVTAKLAGSVQVEQDRLQVIEMSSRKAVAEELLSQHDEKLQVQKGMVEQSSRRIEESQRNQDNLKSELEKVQSTISELGKKSESIKRKIEELNIAIFPLEQQVEAVIGRQGKLLDEVESYRQEFSIAERHTLQAQIKVEKLRGNLDLMQTKIEEDFGMITGETEGGILASQPLPFEELLANLPVISEIPVDFSEQIRQKKTFLRRMGPVNPEAEKEFDEVSERFGFLQEQLQDLDRAEKDLRKVVSELDALMQTEFLRTFQQVDKEFRVIFSQLFNGGTARLFVEDQENMLDSGIEIEATLPGKRKQELALLSGGERSLTAVALIFALLKISPTPFCVLDEVDAMLDESNVVRFGELLRDLSDSTQFIVITHNRNTVQLADILYGVTMGKDSVSQVISLKLDELTDELVQ